MLIGDDDDLNRLGDFVEAGGANCLKPDAGMLVGSQFLKQIQRMGNAIAPAAKHSGGSGASMEIGGAKYAVQERDINHVVILMHPQCFEHMVLVVLVALVERFKPAIDRGDDLLAVAAA